MPRVDRMPKTQLSGGGVIEARQGMKIVGAAIESMYAHIEQLQAENAAALQRVADAEDRMKAAERVATRVEQAEERAAALERLYNEMKAKGAWANMLGEAAEKLLGALDRLPTKMDDAQMVESLTPPEIPLYGTHQWAGVVDGKFRLSSAMKLKP